MSELPTASDGGKRRDESARDAVEIAAYDITDAIDALCESAEYQADDGTQVDPSSEVPLTFGHLRAILAALSAPYVPGCVEVPVGTYDDEAGYPCAHLTVWRSDRDVTAHDFIPAVSR